VTPASSSTAQSTPERSTRHSRRPSWPQARAAVVECVVLAVACLITYWLATHLLSRVHSVGRDDDLLGGMWAVLATIFVLRDSFGKSVAAAVSRMAATSVSFVLCLIYLAFLPFHAWALAVLVGASALAVMLLGRPGDAVTAGITTAVIMVVAAVSPQHAWQQPILRLADTVVGVAVGAVAAWTGLQVQRFLSARSVPPTPPKVKVDLPERTVVRAPRPGRPHLRDVPRTRESRTGPASTLRFVDQLARGLRHKRCRPPGTGRRAAPLPTPCAFQARITTARLPVIARASGPASC
jgi:Fusaric acid resistance protein-like